MKHIHFFGLFLATTFLLLEACSKTPDYPDEPVLTYKGVNKKIINQGSATAPSDTLIITFGFTDGDGDLGDNDSLNIFLFDSRDSSLTPGNIKPIPEKGSGNGISGEIIATLATKSAASKICCIFPDRRACFTDPRYQQDTFSYLIQMRDRAGHWSNTIRTEPITILCK